MGSQHDVWLIFRMLYSVRLLTVLGIDGNTEPEVNILSEQGVMTAKMVESLKRYGVEGKLFV